MSKASIRQRKLGRPARRTRAGRPTDALVGIRQGQQLSDEHLYLVEMRTGDTGISTLEINGLFAADDVQAKAKAMKMRGQLVYLKNFALLREQLTEYATRNHDNPERSATESPTTGGPTS